MINAKSVLNGGTRKWSLENTGKLITGIAKLPKMENACRSNIAKMLHCNTVKSQCQNVALLQNDNAEATLSQCNNAIPLEMQPLIA